MELEFHQLDLRYERLRVRQPARERRLLASLADPGQQHVHDGQLVAHAAMKYCVPLARANAADCVRLVEAMVPHRLTTRQIGRLYQAYISGADATRELVLTDPLLVLRVTDDAPHAPVRPDASGPEALMTDLHILGAVARRAHRRLQHGGGLLPPERDRAWRLFDQIHTDFRDLQHRCEKELRDARSGTAHGHLELADEGPRDPPDCPGRCRSPAGRSGPWSTRATRRCRGWPVPRRRRRSAIRSSSG